MHPILTPSLPQVYAAPICFIFDLITDDSATEAALTSAVKSLLENESKLKLIHDRRRLAAALRYQLHTNMYNVFDTPGKLSVIPSVTPLS